MINIIKIYFWQLISIIFNFASIFVVTPFLASNPVLYGIYTLVSSANIFLAYADFGFLGAGMKFASECYAQKDLKQEIRIIGFTGFIFLMFVCLFALGVLYVSFNPELLIKNLYSDEQRQISKYLLLILAGSAPVFMLQRVLQIIFAVRLQDYVFQKILICSNIVKIISAFIFFSHNHYPIVAYFLFSQICSLAAILIGFWVVKSKLGYDLLLFFRSLRFNKELYKKTKSLAFVSIFLTICWILYYELDPFVISKLMGSKQLAVYAIGFTLMEYFRSIFGIIFSPFIAKFNYYIGLKDFDGLKNAFIKVLAITLPLIVFPIISVSSTIQSFIFTWVGPQYAASVPIARILVLGYLFNFITSPTGILIMAYERARMLYFTNALLPLIYWLGIFFTFKFLGLQAFADFKMLSFIIVTITYLIIIVRIMNIKFWNLIWKLIAPVILPLCFLLIVLNLTKGYLPIQKGKINLMLYFVYNGIIVASAMAIYYFSSSVFKEGINSIIGLIFSKLNKNKLVKNHII
jgi:O-antigen/teichoic acid export membrane protein